MDITFVRLSPSYLQYATATTSITFIVLALPLSGLWIGVENWIAGLVSLLWVALLIATLLLRRYQYRIKGYVLRTHDIVYRTGLIFRRITTIPFTRIQHCELQEGPVERFFSLNTLLIYTAGGSSSDLAIPGLPPAEAQRLRNFILQKISGKDEEE